MYNRWAMKLLVKDFANGKFNDLSSQLTDSTIERVRMFQKENIVEITLRMTFYLLKTILLFAMGLKK